MRAFAWCERLNAPRTPTRCGAIPIDQRAMFGAADAPRRTPFPSNSRPRTTDSPTEPAGLRHDPRRDLASRRRKAGSERTGLLTFLLVFRSLRPVLIGRQKVMLRDKLRHLVAKYGPMDDGGAVVHPVVHARVDYFADDCISTIEVAIGVTCRPTQRDSTRQTLF